MPDEAAEPDDSWDLAESHHLTRERADSPRVGMQAGDYDLLERLGSGAMGTVFVGRHRALDLRHAVKIVERLTPGSDRRRRFEREGAALSKVSHPGVIKVHQFGYLEETIGYFSMDLVEGSDLEAFAADAWPEPSDALRLVAAIARALEHMHQAGIVHRDLKPANVLIRKEDQQPVLVDLGLARDPTDARLTRTNQIVGTPTHMPPEQITGQQDQIGPGTDVFALGVILYQLLTHQLPFTGSDLTSLASAILNSTPPEPSSLNEDLDPVLDSIVARMLAKEPRQRPGAGWVAETLERLLRGESVEIAGPPPNPRTILAGAAVTLALGALALAALWPQPPVVAPAPVAKTPAQTVTEEAPPDPRLAELDRRGTELLDRIKATYGSDECAPLAEAGLELARQAQIVFGELQADAARERAVGSIVDAALCCHRKRYSDHRPQVDALLRIAGRIAPDDPRPELARRMLVWSSDYFRSRKVPSMGKLDPLPARWTADPRWSAAHYALAFHERVLNGMSEPELLAAGLDYPLPKVDEVSYCELFVHEQLLQRLRGAARREFVLAFRSGEQVARAYQRIFRVNDLVLRVRRLSALGNSTRFADEVIDQAALTALVGRVSEARERLTVLERLRPVDREGRMLVLAYCQLLEGHPDDTLRMIREVPPYSGEVRGRQLDRYGLQALALLAKGKRGQAQKVRWDHVWKAKACWNRFVWLDPVVIDAALAGEDYRQRLCEALAGTK